MDTTKIIKGAVSSGRYTVTAPIVKEDYGLYLQIEGVELPSTYEVDFSNSENNGTSVTMIGNADGVLIPRQFIDSGKDVFAFLYHVGQDFGRTVYKFRIPNKVRPDRTNEEPTPEEQSVIDQTISALNDAVERAEDAQQAIEDMSVSATTLAEGESATVTKTESEGVVHLEFGIPKGATGDTPTITASKTGKTTSIYVDDSEVAQIEDGTDGTDGVSPRVSFVPIAGGIRLTITDKDGDHSADIMNGEDGGVTDVKINNYSRVVDGVAQINIGNGLRTANNDTRAIMIRDSNQGQIRTRSTETVLTPDQQHLAVYYGLAYAAGDTTQQNVTTLGAYTEDAKSAISEMLGGSVAVSGTTPTIVAKSGIRYVCGEVATLDITPSATGICDVVFTSGSTPTVVTLPSTVKFPDGAFTAEADTTYEINILDGIYGAVMSWT